MTWGGEEDLIEWDENEILKQQNSPTKIENGRKNNRLFDNSRYSSDVKSLWVQLKSSSQSLSKRTSIEQ